MLILCHPLTHNITVYRAILKKSFINKNVGEWRQVLPGAFLGALLSGGFLPRHKEGASIEEGISLHLADRTPERYSQMCGLENYGTASLEVGGMRGIGLDVIHDGDKENEHCDWLNRLHHCSVLGIPKWEAGQIDALREAEDIADRLSQQAQLLYDKTNTYNRAQSNPKI